MEKYYSYHDKDKEIIGQYSSVAYCTNLTAEEKAMVPFLSFPITKDCNFSCVYCGHYGEATGSTVDCIEIKKMKELVQMARKLYISKFRLTGGEPFLHKNIDVILAYFSEIGCYTLINTNGSLIMKHKDILDAMDSHTIKFAISLDTLKPDKFIDIARPKSSLYYLQDVLDGIKYLSSRNLLLRINMVVGTHNIKEVYDMIKFCDKYNCDLKLLDIVSVPDPFGKRQDYFIDLTPLEKKLEARRDNVHSHAYTKKFGVPCVKHIFGNVKVTVKNGCKGTHYDTSGVCQGCLYYPCHEGLYDIFALSDGRICPCRWTEKQTFESSEGQLAYLIEAFQKSEFVERINNIHENMDVREDLIARRFQTA